MDHKNFKTTVTRPFHIQTRLATDEYRDGWDRIWGRRDFDKAVAEVVEKSKKPDKKAVMAECNELIRTIWAGKGKG